MTRGCNIILLTGAPERDQLDWTTNSLLERAASQVHQTRWSLSEPSSTDSSFLPKWRQLQQHPTAHVHVSASPADTVASLDDIEQWCEHADTFLSSKLSFDRMKSFDDDSEMLDSFYSALSETEVEQEVGSADVLNHVSITDLASIPSAREVASIKIKSMTINILVSIVAVRPTRTVVLRRSKLEMDIVEIVASDDTRAGFGITVWLVPLARSTRQGLRKQVVSLRPGQVVLFCSIALNVYQDVVYGSTLGGRDATRLYPLGHSNVPIDLSAKVEKVATSADRYIAIKPKLHDTKAEEGRLPPDTQ